MNLTPASANMIRKSNRSMTWKFGLAALVAATGCGTAGDLPQESFSSDGDENVTSAEQQLVTCVTIQRDINGTVNDAFVWQGQPGYNTAGAVDLYSGISSGTEQQALLRFDVSSIPNNATITSATVTVAIGAATRETVRVHRVTAPWTESGATWSNTRGGYDPAVATSFTTGIYGNKSFDISTLAQSWVNGATPNYGILLEQDLNQRTSYKSSERGTPVGRPKLEICYDVSEVATVTCSDGLQNGDETGVDCGGSCAACAACDDGLQNGGETGIDCGGSCAACSTCEDGVQNGGEAGIDCGGSCAACPSCSDGHQNGTETGVDCGGSCAACSACSDGVQDGGETGVDCGGPCTACPSCSDGLRNGSETGIDCGGSCAACGGFLPSDLPGLRWWIRADDVVVANGRVVSLTDKSGRGNTVTQSNPALQVVRIDSAPAFNGQPTLRFTRKEYYEKAGTLDLPWGSESLSTFAVGSVAVLPDEGPNAFYGYGSNATSPHVYLRIQGINRFRAFMENTFTTTLTAGDPGTAHVFEAIFAQNDLHTYRDGVAGEIFTGAAMWNRAQNPILRVGTSDLSTISHYFNGDIAELVLYSGALSTADRQKVEQYIKNRYGIL